MNTKQHTSSERITAWSFVGVQAILLIAIVVLPRNTDWIPTDPMRGVGAGFIALGVTLGGWAFLYLGKGLTPSPLPNAAGKLVVKGPYAFARHPIYTGVMLLAAGIALRSGSYFVVAATVGLVALFSVKARWEEKHLAASYIGYGDYMATSGRFVPRIGRVDATQA